MVINLLLTAEMRACMPETVKEQINFGQITVRFPALNGNEDDALHMIGDNVVLEANENEFVSWLRPFDGVAVGQGGSPQFEQFTIMHIKD